MKTKSNMTNKQKFNQASWNYPEETEILVVGNPNKQKIDWVDRVEELLVKCEQMYLSYKEYSGTIENLCKSENDIKDFISQLLKTQRQQLISEIEGIVGEDEKLHRMFWDSDIVNVEVKIRNELRKEIRERLKQIIN